MAENPRVEELRRRVQSDPTSIAFAALAEEYRRMGRHEEAIEVCRTGLQRHPAYLSARVTLGRALIEVGDFEGARVELETVLTSAPENLAAIRGLAQIHERLGHSTEMHPDLAALAAQPMPVKETPPPLKIDLPDTAGGHTALEIDLPAASPVHQTLDIDLPLEGGATDSFEIDLPAAPDATATATATETETVATEYTATTTHTDTDSDTDSAIGRLERFLTAVQHARSAAASGSGLRR